MGYVEKVGKGMQAAHPCSSDKRVQPFRQDFSAFEEPGGKSFCALLPCLPFTRFPFNPFALLPFSYPISCSRAAFAATATPSIDRRPPLTYLFQVGCSGDVSVTPEHLL